MPVSLSPSLSGCSRTCLRLLLVAGFWLWALAAAQAQIFFGLPAETVKQKAGKAGFEFAYTEGAGTDSTALVFRKKTDPQNRLVCFLNADAVCYQFGYRLPPKMVPTVIQNLSKQLVKRGGSEWENREQTFVVVLLELPGYTTIMYRPWQPPE